MWSVRESSQLACRELSHPCCAVGTREERLAVVFTRRFVQTQKYITSFVKSQMSSKFPLRGYLAMAEMLSCSRVGLNMQNCWWNEALFLGFSSSVLSLSTPILREKKRDLDSKGVGFGSGYWKSNLVLRDHVQDQDQFCTPHRLEARIEVNDYNGNLSTRNW